MIHKEPKKPRSMRIVRAWIGEPGIFKYFAIYSDGSVRKSSAREARQFMKAYGLQRIETVLDEPRSSELT